MDACKTLTVTTVLLLVLICGSTDSSANSIDYEVPSTDVGLPGKVNSELVDLITEWSKSKIKPFSSFVLTSSKCRKTFSLLIFPILILKLYTVMTCRSSKDICRLRFRLLSTRIHCRFTVINYFTYYQFLQGVSIAPRRTHQVSRKLTEKFDTVYLCF